jgi:4-diphosphocytidyl-2-C-methyl-D-erythritol kinase
VKFRSPAKVNLHLQILGKRADGYHEIQSLMVPVGLYDDLEIRLGGSGIRFAAEGEVPAGSENIAWKAAEALCREWGQSPGIQIHLFKRIPVAAGLGGGSSNAATVLKGLNILLKAGLTPERLMALAAKIGADVPFFLFEKPALARGIGERLTEVVLPPSLWLLMVVPSFSISTPWAYSTYDRLAKGKQRPLELKENYADIDDLLPVLKNDLELAALSKHPEIGRMKDELIAQGARGALMSGSGSVIFGLFPGEQEALQAEKGIALPAGWKTMVTPRI